MVNIPSDALLEKTHFSLCPWVSIINIFLVQSGLCVHSPLVESHLAVSCVVYCTYFCVHHYCCIEKILFPWSLQSPPALKIFLHPLLHRSLSPEGKVLMKTSHLVFRSCKSFAFYWHVFWDSVLINQYSRNSQKFGKYYFKDISNNLHALLFRQLKFIFKE